MSPELGTSSHDDEGALEKDRGFPWDTAVSTATQCPAHLLHGSARWRSSGKPSW